MEISRDYNLVAQVADGDDDAFQKLYEHYAAPIYAFILHMLQDPVTAEEVTQDTFLKLWNRPGQYLLDRGSVQNWLLAIARHTALDHLRHEARRPILADEYESEELWQNIPDANTFTDEARWQSVHFALQSLSDEQRHLIELVYYQGLSQNEISETMGWPIGTVKTRLRSAMQQLRESWVEE